MENSTQHIVSYIILLGIPIITICIVPDKILYNGSQTKVLSLLCLKCLCWHCLWDTVIALLCCESAFEENYTYCTIQKAITIKESDLTTKINNVTKAFTLTPLHLRLEVLQGMTELSVTHLMS